MTDSAGAVAQSPPKSPRLPAVAVLAVILALLVYAFRDGLAWAMESWDSDEYNHCWLIPPIALFLIATRARDIAALEWRGSWSGIGIVAAGFVLLLLGQLSSIYTISQYGFIVAVFGAFVAVLGWPVVRIIWPALVYLAFIIPLPDFIEVKLTAGLQLISSQIGVAVIRLAGVPVYLEGNVIDLGGIKLAVAEACSGLRYLFPLMSFGFLCAVLYQAPLWQRAIVFLATVPITVLMNSIRIGVIGLLVNVFGPEHAEGFIHDFEGWVVFMACVGILFAMMFAMSRLQGRGLLKSLRMDTPPLAEMGRMATVHPANVVAGVVVAVALAGVAGGAALDRRQEIIPRHGNLKTFPLVVGEWRGSEQYVERLYLDVLKADDTLLALYARPGDEQPVSMWIAYYGSQREGRSAHSPKTCLPGGGWAIQSFREEQVPEVREAGGGLPVNRFVIGMGEDRQLVYYWFVQRGRVLTNEYLVKWYIFWDSLRINRTDGALVRLTTVIARDDEDGSAADRRLQDFIRATDPKLAYYLPQRDAEPLQARAE